MTWISSELKLFHNSPFRAGLALELAAKNAAATVGRAEAFPALQHAHAPRRAPSRPLRRERCPVPMPDLLIELFSEEIPARMQRAGGGGSEASGHRRAGRARPYL